VSDERAFDRTVPEWWRLRRVYFDGESGERLIDSAWHSLRGFR